MKELEGVGKRPNQELTGQGNANQKEQGRFQRESELSKLLEEKGLFRVYTPEGKKWLRLVGQIFVEDN